MNSQEYTRETFEVLLDMYGMSLSGNWASHIIAYHLTPASNVDSIMSSGLIAKSTKATTFGEPRNPAVYLFAHPNDTKDISIRAYLFEEGTEIAVIKVRIPREAYGNMRSDGLFALSCSCEDGSTPYAVQYRGDIPAEWIVK